MRDTMFRELVFEWLRSKTVNLNLLITEKINNYKEYISEKRNNLINEFDELKQSSKFCKARDKPEQNSCQNKGNNLLL